MSSSRKKTRTTAGDAMKLVAKPEPAPALTYAARDSFAFSEGPPVPEAAVPEAAVSEGPPAPKTEPQAALPAAAPMPAAARVPAAAARVPVAARKEFSFAKPAFAAPALLGKKLGEVGSGNVEAVARAGAILAKGLEEMGQSVVALGQSNLESSLNLAKAAFGTTTLRQFVDLHTGYAKDSFDRLLAQGQKLQEISLKTANEALQPLKARMAEAIETLTSKAA